ncbi:spermatogenesis-associated protein 5-like protein 1 [Argonauta hians]
METTGNDQVKLHLEPVESTDCEGQRCRLGSKMCATIGVELGSFVRITTSKVSAICSVWPRPEGEDGMLQFSELVTRDCYKNIKACDALPHIDVLSTANAKSIEISIIARDILSFEKLKQMHKHSISLQEYCRSCLHYVGVSPNVKVNLSKSEVGNRYGMSYIVVHSIKPETADVAILSKATKVRIRDVITEEKYKQRLNKPNIVLGGLEEPAESLKEIVRLPMILKENPNFHGAELPRGVLLHGPPGCGKTTLVKYIGVECDAHLITVNGPELLSAQPGESEQNLKHVFDLGARIGKTDGCILFFDEIDSLCPKPDSSLRSSRLTTQLGLLMDAIENDSGLVVVAASNQPSAIDPAIRRPGRFDREVLLSIPTMTQREKMLAAHLAKMPVSVDVNLGELAAVTTGYSGADLALLCREAAYIALSEYQTAPANSTPVPVRQCHFHTVLKKIGPSLTKGNDITLDSKPISWDNIGGLEHVKHEIQQTIEWPLKYADKFQKLNLSYPHGVLLIGPPGCCKTTLVTTAAHATNTVFMSLTSAQLYSPYVGHSETILTELFTRARACAPSIIFLDELDACFGKRSDGGGGDGCSVKDRLLSTLLNQMDGIGMRLDDIQHAVPSTSSAEQPSTSAGACAAEPTNPAPNQPFVIVVAATNRPELIDEALLRPGRFDRVIYVPPPDELSRLEILKIHTRKMQLNGVDLEVLSKQTVNFTGADLSNLCQQAAMLAVQEEGFSVKTVTMQNFQDALKIRGSSLTSNTGRQYEEIKLKWTRLANLQK